MLSIEELKELKSLVEVKNEIDLFIKQKKYDFEKEIEKHIKITNTKYKILHKIEFYALSSINLDEIWLYRIIDSSNKIWLYNNEVKWFSNVNNKAHDNFTKYNITIETPSFINILDKLVKDLSIFEIPVTFVENKIKGIDLEIEKIREFEDIQVLLGKNTILKYSGEVWYTGWDISDSYFIVEDERKIYHVFYSTDSHGFGCKEVEINNKNDLNKFLYWLEINTKSLNVEKIKQEILQSWSSYD